MVESSRALIGWLVKGGSSKAHGGGGCKIHVTADFLGLILKPCRTDSPLWAFDS